VFINSLNKAPPFRGTYKYIIIYLLSFAYYALLIKVYLGLIIKGGRIGNNSPLCFAISATRLMSLNEFKKLVLIIKTIAKIAIKHLLKIFYKFIVRLIISLNSFCKSLNTKQISKM
jgi:hypothetical protein